MNKKEIIKTKKSKYDDTEDLAIKKVAYDDKSILFYILIVVFVIALCFSCWKLCSNYANKHKKTAEIVKINTYQNDVLIVNNGKIHQIIDKDSFSSSKKEIIIERINSIELKANKKTNENAKVIYDIRYNIKKNTFDKAYNNKSPIIVKFSYSYDKKNWVYIDNVISTNESSITPMVGNSYDVSGIISNLSVITNKELESQKNTSNKIYWRSETIFHNDNEKSIKGEFLAEYKIEYKNGIE